MTTTATKKQNNTFLPAPYPHIFGNNADFYRFLLGLYDRTGGQNGAKSLTNNDGTPIVDFSDKVKFLQSSGAGSGSAVLGTAGPVSVAAPYAWVDVLAPDGTVCTMPMWKK